MAENQTFNFLNSKEASAKYSKTLNAQPEKTVRIRGVTIALSPDLAERYGIDRLNGAYLDVQIDPQARALRLVPVGPGEGGSYFAIRDSRTETCASAGIAAYVKRAKMPKGIYKQWPDNPDVFVWQEPPLVELPEEEPPHIKDTTTPLPPVAERYDLNDLAVGDVVGWLPKASLDYRKPMYARGTVREIAVRGTGARERLAANIALDRTTKEAGRYKVDTITIDLEKLTILEKGNQQDGKQAY